MVPSSDVQKPALDGKIEGNVDGRHSKRRVKSHGVDAPEEVLGTALGDEAGQERTDVFSQPKSLLPLPV